MRELYRDREFQKKHGECWHCHRVREITYLKVAHVPLYGWVCEDCRDEWTSE
jgi:hypothetical protein